MNIEEHVTRPMSHEPSTWTHMRLTEPRSATWQPLELTHPATEMDMEKYHVNLSQASIYITSHRSD
ncbi:hypothetical protein IAQ61_009703 [Plenodomus lingam]|uniref:uncharacterized protein n=1 Tax=Leptosphaeria maculans TaxID=5022 RepID=UPI003319FF79|nr:hypothetical protein IAQ61_009703 [Plenodomus lingam]